MLVDAPRLPAEVCKLNYEAGPCAPSDPTKFLLRYFFNSHSSKGRFYTFLALTLSIILNIKMVFFKYRLSKVILTYFIKIIFLKKSKLYFLVQVICTFKGVSLLRRFVNWPFYKKELFWIRSIFLLIYNILISSIIEHNCKY